MKKFYNEKREVRVERIKSLEIVIGILEEEIDVMNEFYSGDKDTKFCAYENVIGKSVYHTDDEECETNFKEKRNEIIEEFNRLIQLRKDATKVDMETREVLKRLLDSEKQLLTEFTYEKYCSDIGIE